jgi:D-threonate/D-erythronate kinase
MRATVAVVADDLTGAADTGAGFMRAGLETIVTWAHPVLDLGVAEDVDALAIDTRSRVLDGARGAMTTAAVVEALKHAGIRTLYKKIDSMLRGHVGEEVRAALTAWHRGAIAFVAPAFPAVGRTTIGGVQRIDGVPLERGAIAAHLEAAGISTRHAPLAKVRASPDALIAKAVDERAEAIVFDAETDADLRRIAEAGVQLGEAIVWVGSGGLAAAVASVVGVSPGDGPDANRIASQLRAQSPALQAQARPVLIVVGSTSATAARQAAHVQAAGAVSIAIPVNALRNDIENEVAAASSIRKHLREGHDVVVTVDPSSSDDDPRIAARLAEVLHGCAPLVGGIVVTGGDTATGILEAWSISALRLIGEVETGVPLSIGEGKYRMPIVTKAGTFGSAAALTRARARLRDLIHTREGGR